MGKLKYIAQRVCTYVVHACKKPRLIDSRFLLPSAGTSTRLRKTVYGERTGNVRWAVCAPVSILTGTSAIDGVAWEQAKILVGKFTRGQARSPNRKPTPFDISSKPVPPILKWEFKPLIHHLTGIRFKLFQFWYNNWLLTYRVSRHIWRSIVTANTSCTLGATTNGYRLITRISTALASKCPRRWGRRTRREALTRLETAPRRCTRLPVAPTTGRRPSWRWNIRTRSN